MRRRRRKKELVRSEVLLMLGAGTSYVYSVFVLTYFVITGQPHDTSLFLSSTVFIIVVMFLFQWLDNLAKVPMKRIRVHICIAEVK